MPNTQIHSDFTEFGKYIYYAGIFFVISIFISFVGSIGVVITIVMGLQKVKHTNEKLHDPNLQSFYNNLLISQIIYLIASLAMFIAMIRYFGYFMSIFNSISTMSNSSTLPSSDVLSTFNSYLYITLIFGGIQIIGWIFSYVAWGKLIIFFENNQIFNTYVNQQAVDNAGKLKTASIMYILSFLIITACIGLIFFIMGYFGLGNALKDFHPSGMPYERQQYPDSSFQSTNVTESSNFSVSKSSNIAETGNLKIKFCPKCGSQLNGPVKFCPVCGNPIKSYESF